MSHRLAEASEASGNEEYEAAAYHHLGIIAEEQRDFETARKSLDIKEKQGNEHGDATTYHNLGAIAKEQRDFETAKKWYRKSLDIKEKQGNEHDAASTYHQLGMIAEEQRDFETAKKWYRKSLDIKEKQDNEHDAALTYHQLGMIAQKLKYIGFLILHAVLSDGYRPYSGHFQCKLPILKVILFYCLFKDSYHRDMPENESFSDAGCPEENRPFHPGHNMLCPDVSRRFISGIPDDALPPLSAANIPIL